MTVPSGEVRRVSSRILERIVAGAYPSGLRLPAETELARELSCGRSTVREALRHLIGMGVVVSRRGSGATVLDFRHEGTPALLPAYILAGRFDQPVATLGKELLHVRTLLASEAARLAALYAPEGSLGDARTILASCKALEHDPLAHVERELDFFRALVQASEIWPSVWLANAFFAPMRELQAALAPILHHVPQDHQRDMNKLLDLIEQRDAEGASAHVRAFFNRVDVELLDAIGRVLGSAGPSARNGSPR